MTTLKPFAAGATMWAIFVSIALALAAPTAPTALADDATVSANTTAESSPLVQVEVFPTEIKLDTPGRQMRLIVTGHFADGRTEDLSRVAEASPADPSIARVERGVVLPVANGATEIVVRAAGREATSKVATQVSGQESPERVSFQYATLPVLSKQNCNSGACHGSPSGKGGFRLSLRAYDPVFDAETLVREAFNRRVNLLEPGDSLLLRKPTMEVAHGGGKRLRRGAPDYALLRSWIEQGCQTDPADAPVCVKLEVYPAQRTIKRPAFEQQLVAIGHFSDGTRRDVTALTTFSSSEEAVASVDANGLVKGASRGGVAILARYLDRVETASLLFLEDVPGFVWSNPPAANYVDEHVLAKLRQLQIAPSELCRDEEFLRRVFLDVIGSLPTPNEARSFLADPDPQKRSKLIDALLERPEFAEFWALKWGDLLRVRNAKLTNAGVHKFHHWLVAAFRQNMPYDQFTRALLASSGSTFQNPAANYYRAAADVNDCIESTSQVFLGVRIQCAKCHNHPFERWTQDNYYGIGAFFQRVQRKPGNHPEEQVIWLARSGEITQPRTGKQMSPWLPYTGEVAPPPDEDRRELFVDWLTKPDNPFFAKIEANRIWGHLLGRGIVEPIDDFRDSNPPANPALLSALADDFARHDYDRKHLMRAILNSRAYQASATRNPFNQQDVKYFSHATTRLLSAEQLLDAICQVTASAEKFAGLPLGLRATQLPSPDADVEFLKVFGQPARETACQCERSSDANLSQALQMINGPLVHAKVRDEKNRLRTLAVAGKSNAEIVDELYLAAFARRPNDDEIAVTTRHVEAQPDRMQGLEDVCWAIVNSNEFLFQH